MRILFIVVVVEGTYDDTGGFDRCRLTMSSSYTFLLGVDGFCGKSSLIGYCCWLIPLRLRLFFLGNYEDSTEAVTPVLGCVWLKSAIQNRIHLRKHVLYYDEKTNLFFRIRKDIENAKCSFRRRVFRHRFGFLNLILSVLGLHKSIVCGGYFIFDVF